MHANFHPEITSGPVSSKSAFAGAALVLAIAVGSAGLLAAAAFGVAQYTEDLCFDDLDGRNGYGAYRSEWAAWPPSFDCELRGIGVDPVVVQHRGIAVAALLGAAVVPIAFAAGATAGIVSWRRRRRTLRTPRLGK